MECFSGQSVSVCKTWSTINFCKGLSDAKNFGKEETLKKIAKYWSNTYHKPSDEFNKETADL